MTTQADLVRRPQPFGSYSKESIKILKSRGYTGTYFPSLCRNRCSTPMTVVTWSFDSGDSVGTSSDDSISAYNELYAKFPAPGMALNHGSSDFLLEISHELIPIRWFRNLRRHCQQRRTCRRSSATLSGVQSRNRRRMPGTRSVPEHRDTWHPRRHLDVQGYGQSSMICVRHSSVDPQVLLVRERQGRWAGSYGFGGYSIGTGHSSLCIWSCNAYATQRRLGSSHLD